VASVAACVGGWSVYLWMERIEGSGRCTCSTPTCFPSLEHDYVDTFATLARSCGSEQMVGGRGSGHA
jgi:hypothetical protein